LLADGADIRAEIQVRLLMALEVRLPGKLLVAGLALVEPVPAHLLTASLLPFHLKKVGILKGLSHELD
jgi:hypothetical protein